VDGILADYRVVQPSFVEQIQLENALQLGPLLLHLYHTPGLDTDVYRAIFDALYRLFDRAGYVFLGQLGEHLGDSGIKSAL
jgi:hypothetical protein